MHTARSRFFFFNVDAKDRNSGPHAGTTLYQLNRLPSSAASDFHHDPLPLLIKTKTKVTLLRVESLHFGIIDNWRFIQLVVGKPYLNQARVKESNF